MDLNPELRVVLKEDQPDQVDNNKTPVDLLDKEVHRVIHNLATSAELEKVLLLKRESKVATRDAEAAWVPEIPAVVVLKQVENNPSFFKHNQALYNCKA